MKILQIHNHYRMRGGEDVMFEQICSLLRDHKHQVFTFERRSGDVVGVRAKLAAFVTGVYSGAARDDVSHLIRTERPDLVHVHNLYPLVSPSVLEACGERGVPVVMRCPNYRLACPTGLFLRNGKACTRCEGGREYWCALTNCRGDLVESTAMAARSFAVRAWGLIREHVSVFIPPSAFVAGRLVRTGIPKEQIRVVPNTVGVPDMPCDPANGSYIAFAGRLSEEKGVETLLDAARLLPRVPIRVAGEGPLSEVLRADATPNVTFIGQLSRSGLSEFYANARACVVPSVWHEAFGLVAAEAMAHGLPVIASRMGALPEIVDENSTGLLFDAGNAEALAKEIDLLWSDASTAQKMGSAGREKVIREYARDVYYKRLMDVYSFVVGDRTRASTAQAAHLAQSA